MTTTAFLPKRTIDSPIDVSSPIWAMLKALAVLVRVGRPRDISMQSGGELPPPCPMTSS
jgi:hypothetical protein